MRRRYTILNSRRAAISGLRAGQLAYRGDDCYGLARDDTSVTGVEHTTLSLNESGRPSFTIPAMDVCPAAPLAYAGIP